MEQVWFRDFRLKTRTVPSSWAPRVAEKGTGRLCWEESREGFLKVGKVSV